MNIGEYFSLLGSDYTLRTITIGTGLLGAICGMLGSFAVLRKQSLLGDAISHAALPGIALTFILLQTKNSMSFLVGALISGLIGTLWIRSIINNTRLKSDTALGLILSLFFGFGMLLLTFIQKMPNANQAGLEKYLFGQAATLVASDVWIMAGVTGISLLITLLFWKEFKIILFDPDYTMTLGFNNRLIDTMMMTFMVLAIVLGLQTVGVVLMSAMLLAPAAAARQWTNHLWKMVLLASLFGGLSGIIGTAISASHNNLSTGPVIVLVAAGFVFFSFIFAPQRGLLARKIKFMKNKNNLELHKTLSFLFEIANEHQNYSHPHSIKLCYTMHGFSPKSLQKMSENGWIKLSEGMWSLTEKGFDAANNLYNQNLKDK
ncbi:metal ABC transporter permease [Aureibacter tunicatorum]|uniref:Manganese/zinc/iron transport system permease protein n=1 Tax=Aureibacter tunicatorum TaxID=866807 RepID=A0AAE3XPI9_9BACT|nr:metal ABC transporter permease [Aureibacter tunicatorum]MDR6238909.1 manganese/zinc/iron transport system permease protein [Aureibacter tunicatorum]BDD05164.1 zinc ABC transporter permease [Aureibacter tunicatorum]